MRRNKKTTTDRRAAGVLALLLCFCLALSGLAAVSHVLMGTYGLASAEETEGTEYSLGSEDLSLLMPSSYEQFLPMDSVSGIAVSDGYIAVSDGSSIYMYDGTEYRTFGHSVSVVQIEFDGDHILYFIDSNTRLYTLDCTQETLEETYTGLTCASFALSDGGLYYALSTNGSNTICYSDMDTLDDPDDDDTVVDPFNSSVVPAMACADGTLYYMNGTFLCTVASASGTNLGDYAYNIAVIGTTLYFTDSARTYFRSKDLSVSNTELVNLGDTSSSAYSALCIDGEDLYVTSVAEDDHTKIQKFDISENDFTDYEISSSSLSENRLYDAVRAIVTDEYLIVGDAGMSSSTGRLVLYNFETGEYSSFSVAVTPYVIASNGDSILVSNGGELYGYDFEGNPLTGTINDYTGSIVGLGCAEGGDYFFITGNSIGYSIDAESFEKANVGSWETGQAKSLDADIYGNIFVEYEGGAVYRYTPSEFQSSGNGTHVCSFSSDVSQISVDFDGNVYGLSGNTIYRSDGNSYSTDSDGMLYGADNTVSDFAFGYEHGTVYLVYENYILSTESVDVPNLNNLDTGDAYQIIFEQTGNVGSGLVSVITFNENAVFIHFTLDELTADAEVFPYEGYSRISDVNALVLGELEIHGLDYYIVSIYDSSSHSYTAGLALQEVCTLMDESLYTSTPDNFDDGAGYITNDVSLYKYPYLTSALAVTSLSKNTVVTVITEISLSDSIDYDYYYVSWTDDDGETLYGYVPKSFVRDFSALTEQNEAVYYKTLTPDEDITLKSSAGTSYTLSAGTEYTVLVYYSDDGSAMIALTVDSVRYYAVVDAGLFETDTYSALRYFIAVLLILADIAIIVNYSAYRAYQRENERRQ